MAPPRSTSSAGGSHLPRSRHPAGASCPRLGEASFQPRMGCLLVKGTGVLRGACTLQRSRGAHQGDLPPTAIPSKPRNLPWLPADQSLNSQASSSRGVRMHPCLLLQSYFFHKAPGFLDVSMCSTPAVHQVDGPAWEKAGARRQEEPGQGPPLPPVPCGPGKLHPSSLRRQGDTCELGQRCPESSPPGPSPPPQWAAWPMLTLQLTLTFTGLPGALQFAKGFLPID